MSEQLHLVNADEAITGSIATPKPGPDGKHAIKVKPTPSPRHAQPEPKPRPEPKPAPSPKSFGEQIEEAIAAMEYDRDDECYHETLTRLALDDETISLETIQELANRPMPPGSNGSVA